MIAFPEMLVGPAKKAGMIVPENAREFDPNKYPHFQVFCKIQIGISMPSPTAHWDNAEIIVKIPDDKIKKITMAELIDLGIHIST